MKTFNPILSISYSCQICGREIPGRLDQDVFIIPNIQPLCSDDCRLLVIGRVLRQYDNQTLMSALAVALPCYRPDKRINAINKLAVWILNKMNEGSKNE